MADRIACPMCLSVEFISQSFHYPFLACPTFRSKKENRYRWTVFYHRTATLYLLCMACLKLPMGRVTLAILYPVFWAWPKEL